MHRLALFLFGAPRLERDEQPVQVDTRKALALIAYLAMTRTPHSRDALATLLWQENDQAHARGALRRTLSALKAIDDTWLDADRETIALNPHANLCVDVTEFRDNLAQCHKHNHAPDDVCPDCLTPLTQAAAIYRDDFLAGFTLRDSPAFDEWQFFQSEALRRELAGALKKLARLYATQREYETAIRHARRWLALDALHEPAHRELMHLYAASDQRQAALRQYYECVRVLEQELSVPPLEETTRLYEAIKEQKIQVTEQTSPLLPRSPALLPLVGRANELAQLRAIHAAIKTDGHLVIVAGEAGIGKTRLVETFLAETRAASISARCYEGETGLTFAPFIAGLRAALNDPAGAPRLKPVPLFWLSEAARLAPELIERYPNLPPVQPIDSPGAQGRFFESISQLLLALAPRGILFIDDAQWADPASLDLLTYLARRLRGRPLLLLLTTRDGHALDQLHNEAQRARLATTINLTRLNETQVSELAQGAQLAQISRDLFRETEGLPFFVVEYLTALAQTRGAFDWSLPSGARHLLHSRLNSASETARQLLSAAAVIGRSFDFDTVRAASGRGDEETITALEELIARGLICETHSAEIVHDFSHDKLRELVYAETSYARRRLLHRRVADALIARHRYASAWAAQIANHLHLAGQDASAAEYSKSAGDHARALFANTEALTHYRNALAYGHPDIATLHEAIGDLQTLLGEYRAALANYESSVALGEQPKALIEHKIGNVLLRRGEWESAGCHFQAALTALGQNTAPAERARVYADWSLTMQHAGDHGEARDLAQRALELAQSANDFRALAQAHNILGILAKSAGDLEDARRHFEKSLAWAEALNDPGARVAALNNLARAYAARGDLGRASSLVEHALELCVTQGDRHREAALRNNLADLLHSTGKSTEAMAQLKQAAAIFAEIGAEAGEPEPEIWKLVEW